MSDLNTLKAAVCQANLELVKEGLVFHTFGNVSGVDRQQGVVVIKPSGVSYEGMTAEQMSVVSLETGKAVEGLKASSDTPTHVALYRAFPEIGGICHTHSLYATAWAQSKKSIPAFGTTHADYWFGEVPCTRTLMLSEVVTDYELNTGKVIIERFKKLDYKRHPGALVASHGPFTWGATPAEAVHHAVVLEYVAHLASESVKLDAALGVMQAELREKHFLRKHGPNKYYGQG